LQRGGSDHTYVRETKCFTSKKNGRNVPSQHNKFMRNVLALLSLLAAVATFTSGCAGPEEKMGRGLRNTGEIVRLGDMRSTVEQTSVWYGPDVGVTAGVIRGADRSLERTGLGLVEIITAPFPPYHPIFTKYVPPEPGYPDSYVPGLPDDSTFHTDTYIGFSGGEEASFIPGSRFDVYDH
jgi:putative exosortase-associated protein (TIGR04073 family)